MSRNSTDGGPRLETTGGPRLKSDGGPRIETAGGPHQETIGRPHESPTTKEEGATNSAQLDALQATLDNVIRRLNGSRSANHDILVTDLPFTKKIVEANLPDKFKMPHMDRYDGSQDPANHLETYRLDSTASCSVPSNLW